jgi:3-methyladenine DNA glycosylase/8-oxoguanine DNA glycosylase
MMHALLDAFGTRLTFDSKTLFAMWRPEDLTGVSEDDLRALKIGYRARFLKRLSDDFARGTVNERELRTLDPNSTRKALLKLYGVGPETANILLYPACHRYAALNHIAPWQQKIYSRMFYDKTLVPVPKILNDLNEKYGDQASLAVGYVWEDLFWRHSRKPIPWLQKGNKVVRQTQASCSPHNRVYFSIVQSSRSFSTRPFIAVEDRAR